MYKFCLLRAAEQSASPKAALQRDTQEKIRLRSATKIWKPKKRAEGRARQKGHDTVADNADHVQL